MSRPARGGGIVVRYDAVRLEFDSPRSPFLGRHERKDSMIIAPARRLACTVIPALVLAGCGGGGESPPASAPTYGAGATFSGTVGTTTAIRRSLIAGSASQADADALALASCNGGGVTGCEVVVRFGPSRCGAIASGSANPTGTRPVTVWGGGEGASLEAARAAAIAACTGAGGASCTVPADGGSACNAAP
jgi:hypothetical protein